MTTTVGVDIGGTKVLAVRVEDGAIVARSKFETPTDAAALVPAIAEAARRVWTDDVEAVGAGVAGLVRWPEGEFVWGPHVAGTQVPVREGLEAELGVPAIVDNDANAAAWAEMHIGAGIGYRHVLLVTLGTGIGGALVLDGKIYRGVSFAGEWGHMQWVPDGELCDCGKRGCWETVASGPALARLARQMLAQNPEGPLAHLLEGRPITGEEITRAADAGDETARALVAQVGIEFGKGLCSLIAILDPEVIVVGGGLGSVGESLLSPARRVAGDLLHGGVYRQLPPIVVAAAGPDAGAFGAALLARDRVEQRLEEFMGA